MGCHFLLQGIFLTQGLNPRPLQWRAVSFPLSHQESPKALLDASDEMMLMCSWPGNPLSSSSCSSLTNGKTETQATWVSFVPVSDSELQAAESSTWGLGSWPSMVTSSAPGLASRAGIQTWARDLHVAVKTLWKVAGGTLACVPGVSRWTGEPLNLLPGAFTSLTGTSGELRAFCLHQALNSGESAQGVLPWRLGLSGSLGENLWSPQARLPRAGTWLLLLPGGPSTAAVRREWGSTAAPRGSPSQVGPLNLTGPSSSRQQSGWKSESCLVVSDSATHGLYSPWNSPGQNTGVGSLSLLPSPGDLPNPGIEPRSPALRAEVSCIAEPPGNPKNTAVGSLPLLQCVFPTQESNWGLPIAGRFFTN